MIKKTTPQSASLTAPLAQGSQGGALQICTALAGRGTPGDRNHRIGDCAKAPLKKTANQIGVGGGVFDLDTGDELGLRVEYL